MQGVLDMYRIAIFSLFFVSFFVAAPLVQAQSNPIEDVENEVDEAIGSGSLWYSRVERVGKNIFENPELLKRIGVASEVMRRESPQSFAAWEKKLFDNSNHYERLKRKLKSDRNIEVRFPSNTTRLEQVYVLTNTLLGAKEYDVGKSSETRVIFYNRSAQGIHGLENVYPPSFLAAQEIGATASRFDLGARAKVSSSGASSISSFLRSQPNARIQRPIVLKREGGNHLLEFKMKAPNGASTSFSLTLEGNDLAEFEKIASQNSEQSVYEVSTLDIDSSGGDVDVYVKLEDVAIRGTASFAIDKEGHWSFGKSLADDEVREVHLTDQGFIYAFISRESEPHADTEKEELFNQILEELESSGDQESLECQSEEG